MAALKTLATCPWMHALIGGTALVAWSLEPPTRILEDVARNVGLDTLVWAFAALAPACAIVGMAAARLAREARVTRLSLKAELAHAEAESASWYPDEALEGALALSAMGARAAHERNRLGRAAAALALMGAGFAAGAAGAAALAFEGLAAPAHALEAMAVAAAVAAILAGAARAVSRTAGALEPTPEQISASVARYHRRQESEKARERDGRRTLLMAPADVAHQG